MIRKFGLKFIIASILIVLLTSIIMPVCSLAIDKEYTNSKQFDSYTSWANKNIGNTNGSIAKILKSTFGVLLKLARIIALGWAIIMLIAVAIKYMSGSAHVKAQLKTDIPTYLIGAAILFGASGIITIIQWFVDDFI